MKRKVCVVITARPSYSRFKSALKAIEEHPDLELQLVVSASALLDRYGNAVKVIEREGFHIAARVYNVLEGENLTSMAKTTGIAIMELSTVFGNLSPDMVVTIADRYETLATAISAAYMNIPLVHIQGGEVTGSIDEKVRHAITKMADLHLVATEKSKERVIKMGEHPDCVFVTGCPSIDIAAELLKEPLAPFDPFQKYGGVGELEGFANGYLVVMQHPVTTEYDSSRKHITETLYAIERTVMPTLWFWPNVDAGSDGTSKGIRAFREQRKPKNIRFFKNMEPKDFLQLLIQSKAIIGNSSVAIRECSFLGVPAVNIGIRQMNRERGPNVVDVSYDRNEIFESIQHQVRNGRYGSSIIYGNGTAGRRISDLLARSELCIEKQLTY